jgi:hypothetical protein
MKLQGLSRLNKRFSKGNLATSSDRWKQLSTLPAAFLLG